MTSYSVVLPSKCSSIAPASALVERTTRSRCSGGPYVASKRGHKCTKARHVREVAERSRRDRFLGRGHDGRRRIELFLNEPLSSAARKSASMASSASRRARSAWMAKKRVANLSHCESPGR